MTKAETIYSLVFHTKLCTRLRLHLFSLTHLTLRVKSNKTDAKEVSYEASYKRLGLRWSHLKTFQNLNMPPPLVINWFLRSYSITYLISTYFAFLLLWEFFYCLIFLPSWSVYNWPAEQVVARSIPLDTHCIVVSKVGNICTMYILPGSF